MGLSVNNDLVTLSNNFESLKAKVEAIEIIVYGERVLELDDSTWENIRKKRDYILKSTDWTVTPGCSVDRLGGLPTDKILRYTSNICRNR